MRPVCKTYYSTEGTEWRFSPLRAPHHGGLWEASIMEHHLLRVTKGQELNSEEYTTLLHRIKAILNCKPLCSKKGDPDSFVLTSGHFLIGYPIMSLPEL